MPDRIRKLVEKGLAVAGVVVILVPVLQMMDNRLQVAVVLVGILMMQAGIWQLAGQLLPSDRVYVQLREEVDEFLAQIRTLNDRAVQGDREGVEEMRQQLRSRVDDIVEAAGKKKDE